jgi:hypothetical protein
MGSSNNWDHEFDEPDSSDNESGLYWSDSDSLDLTEGLGLTDDKTEEELRQEETEDELRQKETGLSSNKVDKELPVTIVKCDADNETVPFDAKGDFDVQSHMSPGMVSQTSIKSVEYIAVKTLKKKPWKGAMISLEEARSRSTGKEEVTQNGCSWTNIHAFLECKQCTRSESHKVIIPIPDEGYLDNFTMTSHYVDHEFLRGYYAC